MSHGIFIDAKDWPECNRYLEKYRKSCYQYGRRPALFRTTKYKRHVQYRKKITDHLTYIIIKQFPTVTSWKLKDNTLLLTLPEVPLS